MAPTLVTPGTLQSTESLTHPHIFLGGLRAICLFFPAPLAGRCSVFPDLSFVTFDGSHAALFKEAIYILSQSPDEIISVHVLDCKSANLVNAPCFSPCRGLRTELG